MKYSMKKYKYLLACCEELNDLFKSEGSSDRAIIIQSDKGTWRIAILRKVNDKYEL